jgi:hypothetical protein
MITDDIKHKFCSAVLEHAQDDNLGYIEAVIHVSEEFGFGPEMGAKLLSKPIIEKIRIEGEDINLLPKMSQLPF